MDQKELAALHAEAEVELKKIPGVIGVEFGLKEIGGKTTNQISFRVFVKEKRKPEDLNPAEIIPKEYKGIPTDVLVVPDITPVHCQDMDHHSPLIGGISISGFRTDSNNLYDNGTLGFFATLNGVSGPENVVLVSNNHVLTFGGATVSDTVYQPKFVEQNGQVAIVLDQEQRHPIGKINNAGKEGIHSYAYPSEAAVDFFVDAATAKLDICISSWCNTNCGVSYKNEIRGLNIGGNSKLEDVDRVKQTDLGVSDYVVYKVGRRTSKTKGKVIGIGDPTGTKGWHITIEATEADCDGIIRFVEHGDSGSALVNAQNKLVGIVFAKSGSNPAIAYACHIHPVIDLLSITPITTANPPVGPAGQTLNDVEGIFTGINHTTEVRERFLNTRKGAEIYQRILDHRQEVVALVNHRRPVTVAWHRSKGPAFLAHFVNNARDPAHLIPFEVEGITRDQMIRRMAEVLTQHGSESLQQVIQRYFGEVMGFINSFDNLHEFVKQFENASGSNEFSDHTARMEETIDVK
ncbi:hypothetical protein [Nitrosomonas oligotropha]|uniref:Trypsin-like peptidase domain-containing protein n=1 Tax=Nitrosomonas oligotropha TaxID=42354 RepID=A0A1H8NAJ4_9PROT|nr:hypothetical protein [Nitrosomonas oligotropha]SDX07475.1 hypothetical protein SAMN05216300_11734 [Nitrosomonas oligotropha]SEO26459.1 hypothetical protein SAMN05216333_10734 [Nitrosomonas oligotropha]